MFIAKKGKKYTVLNTVMGVFACAAQEMYRRVAAPYEDEKKNFNGDIL
jgi:hypothetical protein